MLSLAPARRRAQRGLSIVEMMVGVAVGLLVVAAASLVVSGQLLSNRNLLLDTQIQQDLRATADIIARDLRRAGYSNQAQLGVWYRGTPQVVANTFMTISPETGSSDTVTYQYRRSGSDTSFGFKLEGGVIKTLLGGTWQPLTDSATLNVTALTITAQSLAAGPATAVSPQDKLPCPKLCSDGSTDCWPTLTVRDYTIDISGQAANDSSVKRSIRSTVRLRNDRVLFNDPLNPTLVCPT